MTGSTSDSFLVIVRWIAKEEFADLQRRYRLRKSRSMSSLLGAIFLFAMLVSR
jgi:hypothetical protein